MSFSTKPLILLNILTSITNAFPAKPSRASSTCGQVIEGAGTFMKSATFTFPGTTLPSGLIATDNQLVSDQDQDPPAPYNHIFEAENVFVKDGYLNIKVPGAQNPASAPNQAVSSGEVFTEVDDILYASVRTHAIFSTVPGTCQSSFFYKTDSQEIDIEFISDPTSQSNQDGVADIHYTNQAIDGSPDDKSWTPQVPPNDLGTVVHEYRIDWTADFTAFYVDGVQKQKYTTNVPSQAGAWLWNNWSNGDEGWTVGPPKQDSMYKIQKIEMYYNTTGKVTGCA